MRTFIFKIISFFFFFFQTYTVKRVKLNRKLIMISKGSRYRSASAAYIASAQFDLWMPKSQHAHNFNMMQTCLFNHCNYMRNVIGSKAHVVDQIATDIFFSSIGFCFNYITYAHNWPRVGYYANMHHQTALI